MQESLEKMKECILADSAKTHLKKPSECLIEAGESRSILRKLAQTLATNRNLVQLNKEKIEKSRVFLEGLEYYKVNSSQM